MRLLKQSAIAYKRQRERVHSQRRRRIADATLKPCVESDRPWRGKYYQREILFGPQQLCVMRNKLSRYSCEFFVTLRQRYLRCRATIAKSSEMIFPAIQPMPHRAAHVRDCGPHDEAGIM